MESIADMRLSDKDENGSCNDEYPSAYHRAYTNLYRVWKTEELERASAICLDIFTDKLLNRRLVISTFFNDEGRARATSSYGRILRRPGCSTKQRLSWR